MAPQLQKSMANSNRTTQSLSLPIKNIESEGIFGKIFDRNTIKNKHKTKELELAKERCRLEAIIKQELNEIQFDDNNHSTDNDYSCARAERSRHGDEISVGTTTELMHCGLVGREVETPPPSIRIMEMSVSNLVLHPWETQGISETQNTGGQTIDDLYYISEGRTTDILDTARAFSLIASSGRESQNPTMEANDVNGITSPENTSVMDESIHSAATESILKDILSCQASESQLRDSVDDALNVAVPKDDNFEEIWRTLVEESPPTTKKSRPVEGKRKTKLDQKNSIAASSKDEDPRPPTTSSSSSCTESSRLCVFEEKRKCKTKKGGRRNKEKVAVKAKLSKEFVQAMEIVFSSEDSENGMSQLSFGRGSSHTSTSRNSSTHTSTSRNSSTRSSRASSGGATRQEWPQQQADEHNIVDPSGIYAQELERLSHRRENDKYSTRSIQNEMNNLLREQRRTQSASYSSSSFSPFGYPTLNNMQEQQGQQQQQQQQQQRGQRRRAAMRSSSSDDTNSIASSISSAGSRHPAVPVGRYHVTSCPICLRRFHSSTLGSDRKGIRFLSCGHVFDDTCWSKWNGTGRSNAHQCPVCKQRGSTC